jgi:hypothetical protein
VRHTDVPSFISHLDYPKREEPQAGKNRKLRFRFASYWFPNRTSQCFLLVPTVGLLSTARMLLELKILQTPRASILHRYT